MTGHALDAEKLPKGDSEPLCDFFSDEELRIAFPFHNDIQLRKADVDLIGELLLA
jgi:hypothetical protein